MTSPQQEKPTPTVQRKRQSIGWPWLLALGVLAVFMYLSIRPVMRLRSEPPSEFFDAQKNWDAKRRAAEDQLARAYWTLAVYYVQWVHTYGTNLPDEPVGEFKVEGNDFPAGVPGGPVAARARYWLRLQQVWRLPHAWEKKYEFSLDWFTGALLSFKESAEAFVQNLLARFRT